MNHYERLHYEQPSFRLAPIFWFFGVLAHTG